MRALLPTAVDAVGLHDHYAADWLSGGGIRADFVTSVDGAASADGRSRGLQTPADNAVFAALRDLADVVLVGAGTARTEGYRALAFSPARQALRASYGLGPAVPLAIVSRSGRLDPQSPLFDPSAPRTVVLTCTAAEIDDRLAQVADVVTCGADHVDLAAARTALVSRGLTRILCEGGPSLFGDLVRADQVDEICLSITPLLAGPGADRILTGQPWATDPMRLHLAGLLEEDGALFARYRVT
jgi:riboflavin biosynthesis pyrimidine reductase